MALAFSCTVMAPLVGQSPPSILVDCGFESLQGAIDAAPPEVMLVVQGACGPIEVRKSITLVGVGAASISSKRSDTRPLVSVFAGRVALSRMSIVGGQSGVRVWAGGSLRATDVRVRGSLREGVRIDGVATMSRGTIEDNGWEGIVLTGRGPVTIEDTTVRNNSRDGIFTESRDVLIRRSHVTENAADGLNKAGPGLLSVQQSSFTFNEGSGIDVGQSGVVDDATTVHVTNSTFAFNQTGFAVRILEDLRHDVRLTHTTVVRNVAFGLIAQVDIRSQATIVSANGADCDTPEGRLLSAGWTLVGNPGICAIVPGFGDLLGVAAHLGTIATSGATQFVPLMSKSPGIDRVSVRPVLGGAGTCATSIKADQRGVARPSGPGCDIGAIERRPGDP